MGQEQSHADDLEDIVQQKENLIKQAAEKIAEADFLLLATGAGFSADSGLAVYKDIADVPAYHEMGVDYMDLCQPQWLEKDPEIFYGFWGMCFNDYRKTTPHDGYTIIKKWRDAIHCSSDDNAGLEKALEGLSLDEKLKKFFVYTSNVDSHSQKSGFLPDEVHEIHGSTEVWQCSIGCTAKCWEAPPDFQFEIDTKTMRCKKGEKKPNATPGWETNHPTCPHCGSLARPSILMFGDDGWIDGRSQQRTAYSQWKTKVFAVLKKNPNLKAVVIEAGCGIRVPTVRWQTDGWMEDCPIGQCTVVRINPDYPGGKKDGLIRIVGHSKDALGLIDQHVQKIKTEKQGKL